MNRANRLAGQSCWPGTWRRCCCFLCFFCSSCSRLPRERFSARRPVSSTFGRSCRNGGAGWDCSCWSSRTWCWWTRTWGILVPVLGAGCWPCGLDLPWSRVWSSPHHLRHCRYHEGLKAVAEVEGGENCCCCCLCCCCCWCFLLSDDDLVAAKWKEKNQIKKQKSNIWYIQEDHEKQK